MRGEEEREKRGGQEEQKQSFDIRKGKEGEKNRIYTLSEQTPLLINTRVNV